jgi:UDP-N-acetylglucosamine 2-epimerase (non-hydrolysing)
MKILCVFGTRPEAIKMAPVLQALLLQPAFTVKVCVTGQHRQMLDQILTLFRIQPDYDLDLMQEGQDLFDLSSRILLGLRQVLDAEQPDLLLVQGDTTTCFVASLAALYRQIAVGHVEAGLRTGDLSAPFPEEANRVMTSRLAQIHFAPTEQARKNLLAEGIAAERIHVTGNTVIDALLWVREKLEKVQDWAGVFGSAEEVIRQQQPYVLITGHRRENFGLGFQGLCEAIALLAQRRPEVHFVYPVHLNPRVQTPVYTLLHNIKNIHLLAPLDYLPFVHALNRATIVLTDSGGVQEEAPSLGKPVLVMREKTERPEAVAAGTVLLVGTNRERIVQATQDLLDDHALYQRMAAVANPYGDGQAAQRIVNILHQQFLRKPT